MSAKIVSSGASGKRGFSGTSGGGGQAALTEHYIGFGDSSNLLTGSSNLQWDESTRTMELLGDAEGTHLAIIECLNDLTVQSTGNELDLNGQEIHITSGSRLINIQSNTDLNLSTVNGNCTLDISNAVNIFAQNGNVFIEALGTGNEIDFISEGQRFVFQGTAPDSSMSILLNNITNTIFTPDNKTLILQSANGLLGFFDNTGIHRQTVTLNSVPTLTGLQTTLNALLTALGNTSGSGYGLIAN